MAKLAVPKKYRVTIESCIDSYGPCETDQHALRVITHLQWEHGLELPDLINRLHPDSRPTIMLHEGDLEKGIPTVWLLGWSQHEKTGLHGHGESAAAVGVLQGTIVNVIPMQDFEFKQWIRKGSVFTFPAGAVHDVYGVSDDPGNRDVTVHAYWPPLTQMQWFDEKGAIVSQWTDPTTHQREENLE